jgi:hypothetical protein
VTFISRAATFIEGTVTFIEGAVTFAKRAVTFVSKAMTFIGGAVTFVGEAATFVEGTVTFADRAVTSVGGAVTFIGKGSLAIRRSFKTAEAGVADNRVNGHNLRRRLMTYKLKGPSVSINSLISASDHSVRLSSWATSYSTYSTDSLLKTHTPLR